MNYIANPIYACGGRYTSSQRLPFYILYLAMYRL